MLTVIPTCNGKSFHKDGDQNIWRTFLFVEGVQTREAVQSPAEAFQAGKAFGEFQCDLMDLSGGRLAETIPNFHNTRKRYKDFQKAVQSDPCNRASSARQEIAFAEQRQDIAGIILDAMSNGEIPERITHNDTKFNNLLLDAATGEVMCVVDLDTVMPGCVLYDFGDMIRSMTNSAREDETDLSKVQMRMPMFKALAKEFRISIAFDPEAAGPSQWKVNFGRIARGE